LTFQFTIPNLLIDKGLCFWQRPFFVFLIGDKPLRRFLTYQQTSHFSGGIIMSLLKDALQMAFVEKKQSRNEAGQLVESAKEVILTLHTVPRMRKRDNPLYDRVHKVARVRAKVGAWDYMRDVNEQRLREGKLANFIPAGRRWGTRVRGTPFVEHKGNTHIEYREIEVLFKDYLVDNRPATAEEVEVIEEFLSRRSSEGARQELDNPVKPRDPHLTSVVGIEDAPETEEEVLLMVVARDELEAPVAVTDL
jgi:hypothetical protein